MNVGGFLVSLCINCLIIYILHVLHKRSISNTIQNVRKEVYELENLVVAIIEEFEEVADGILQTDSEKSGDRSVENKKKIEKPVENPIELPAENSVAAEILRKDESEEPDSSESFPDYPALGHEGTPEAIPMFQPHEKVDPRHNRILQLWKDGLAIEEIAKQLGTGRGEVQLVLGIHKRG